MTPRDASARSLSHLATVLGAALVVAAAVAASLPLETHFVAVFRVVPTEAADLDWQNELLNAAIAAHRHALREGFDAHRLWTDLTANGRARMHVVSGDRQGALRFADAVSRSFSAAVERVTNQLRATPSSTEIARSSQTEQLRTRIAEAQRQLDAEIASLPSDDPRLDRDALLSRWQMLRADWSSAREGLAQAVAQVDELRAQPEPTGGLVSAAQHRQTIEGDPALQQDLKELRVRLSELKLHLLTVWQHSAGRLEQLQQSAAGLARTLTDVGSPPPEPPIVEALAAMIRGLSAYRELLDPFQQLWTADFTALQQSEIDPQSNGILDVYEHARTRLHDFLFAAGQHLTALRSGMSSISKNPADRARHHVLESNLTRAFQALQSAHHRFEFAAGNLETPENFRMDAALRGGRGLRRRIQEQIQILEQRLEREATLDARDERAQALTLAERTVQRLQTTSDSTVDELFTVHEGLWNAASVTEAYATRVLRAELTAQRVQTLQRDLAAAEETLGELATARQHHADRHRAEFISCDAVGTDMDWPRRLRIGAVGFLFAMGTGLATLWMTIRKPM